MPGSLGAHAVDLIAATEQAGKKYGLGSWFTNQIRAESNFNPNARSGAGALGIAQFMPGTAKGVGLANPFDPYSALDASAKLMAGYVQKYGDVAKALAAYNAGPGNVSRWQSIPETRAYVQKILHGQAPATTGVRTLATAVTPAAPAPAPLSRKPVLNQLGLSQNVLGKFVSGGGRIDLGALNSMTSAAWSVPSPVASRVAGQPAEAGKLPPQAGSGTGGAIAKTALTQIGIPYKWGGEAKLGAQTDCSGLLQASARANGVNIGRTTYEQWKQGAKVPLNQMQPGDAVFFHPGPRGPEHVAIYIGNGQVVEDPHTGSSVHISKLAGRGAIGARRY